MNLPSAPNARAPEIAACIRRLSPCWQDPRRFYRARDNLAAAVGALATPAPCSSCAAGRLRHALDAARRAARTAQDRAERAERLLTTARRRPGPARRIAPQNQLDLWP